MFTLFFTLTVVPLLLVNTEGLQETPSFKLIINKSGIKNLQDQLAKNTEKLEKRIIDDVKIPDVRTSSYKLTNVHITKFKLKHPTLEIVPGVGLRTILSASGVMKSDYKVKALFFWIDGKATVKTSLSLDVTIGVDDDVKDKLEFVTKECRLNFQSFDLDLHNFLLSAVAGLMKETITGGLEKAVCVRINKFLDNINTRSQLFFKRFEIHPEITFDADKIEFSAGPKSGTNLDPMPDPTNSDHKMVCLIMSKNLLEKLTGTREKGGTETLKKIEQFLPVLKKVKLHERGNFFEICSDLDLIDITK